MGLEDASATQGNVPDADAPSCSWAALVLVREATSLSVAVATPHKSQRVRGATAIHALGVSLMQSTNFLTAVLLTALLAQAGALAAADVGTRSGGVGETSQQALRAQESDYSLKLVFAETTGASLADVAVQISDRSGSAIVNDVSGGPWFLADLPAGRYLVSATYAGMVKTAEVEVPAEGLREVTITWPSSADQ
jgi:hypothetical protein